MSHQFHYKTSRFISGLWLLFVCACTGPVEEENFLRSITLSANAIFAAYQDGPIGIWRSLVPNKATAADFFTFTFIINDRHGRFSLVLACPSEMNDDGPHQVELYHLTIHEVQQLDHVCQRSKTNNFKEFTIGQIKGTDTDNEDPAQREQTLISLDSGASAQVDEAYGLAVTDGRNREILAMRGPLENQLIQAREFYIERGVDFKKSGWSNKDIDFNRDRLTADASSQHRVGVENIRLAGGEVGWVMEVNLISESGITLNMARTTEQFANFYSVPLYNNVGTTFLQADEGHEFVVTVLSEQGQAQRLAYRFFGTEIGSDTALLINQLPQLQPEFTRFMTYVQSAPYAQFEVVWDAVSDPSFGPISVYRWQMEADSAQPPDPRTNLRNQQVRRSQWTVSISNAWLDVDEDSRHVYRLPDPSQFAAITDVYERAAWQQAWGLQAGSTLSWRLSLLSSESNAGDIIHYKLAKRFANNMLLGEVIQSGELKPPQ